MTDIVERLRSYEASRIAKQTSEAADTIEALRAENARLLEALRPFADLADKIEAANDDDDYHFPAAKISDLRAARAAMGESDE